VPQAARDSNMREISKTVIVPYAPEQMFRLVDDVEHYPEFLPWCGGVEIGLRDDKTTRATLRLNYRGVKQSFTTENMKNPPDVISMRLIEGPFRSLDGSWRFIDLAGRGCKIDFRLSYDFSNRILATLVGPVFNYIADTLVDAFVKRAERIYGQR
jgi:ribosome-associated toxin RatA of RatAB toxin-antitoxin module